jgi:hypothetical protein
VKDFTATIVENSPRAADWLKVFGGREIILKYPFARTGDFPGVGARDFYELDLAALTPEQRTRMIVHLASYFHLSEDEVQSTFDDVGCPILAEDVIVAIYNPIRWLS